MYYNYQIILSILSIYITINLFILSLVLYTLLYFDCVLIIFR